MVVDEAEAAIDPSKVGEEPPLALLRVSSEVLRAPFKGLGGLWGGSSGPPWTPARLSFRAGMAGGGLKNNFVYFHFDELFYKKFSILILAYVILSYTADQDQSHVQY